MGVSRGTTEQRWMAQWREAATLLENQKRAELRQLTAADALEISERVLSLCDPESLPPHRVSSSGLVEQQALFHPQRK